MNALASAIDRPARFIRCARRRRGTRHPHHRGDRLTRRGPNRPPTRDGWRCGPVASRGLCGRRRRDHGQIPVAWVLFGARRQGAR
ncbi:hypothetical protein [Pseudonocardia sp.]|uniref:hypothetical protein n=1 Tax=Pseudonocardia sp. TaxID=60912 RepID=UPI0039C9A3E5